MQAEKINESFLPYTRALCFSRLSCSKYLLATTAGGLLCCWNLLTCSRKTACMDMVQVSDWGWVATEVEEKPWLTLYCGLPASGVEHCHGRQPAAGRPTLREHGCLLPRGRNKQLYEPNGVTLNSTGVSGCVSEFSLLAKIHSSSTVIRHTFNGNKVFTAEECTFKSDCAIYRGKLLHYILPRSFTFSRAPWC